MVGPLARSFVTIAAGRADNRGKPLDLSAPLLLNHR